MLGYVVSYSEMIVPTIGLAKPKDFHLQERGVGFNPDSDTILSKGRIAGTSKYNTTFKMSYFNPTFLTKITVDSVIPTPTVDSTPFAAGTYITGSKSGAYGVIEGSPNGLLSSGNLIYCKVLSGQFVEGETIFDEKGNSLRIARENLSLIHI